MKYYGNRTKNRISSESGFTLVELIMVIVIVDILSSVAVPKFINLSDAANGAKCSSNRGAIASAMAMSYCAVIIDDPSETDWLEDAVFADVDDSMFASGATPSCPTTGTLSISEGIVTCTVHGT
jgi:MSHA pilin protein MshA